MAEGGNNVDYISWDDRLSNFDGRRLTSDQKEKNGLKKADYPNLGPGAALYRCPNDSVSNEYYPRTYALNAARWYWGNDIVGGVTNRNSFTRDGVVHDFFMEVLKNTQVDHPADFLVLVERPNLSDGGLGRESLKQVIFDPDQSYEYLPPSSLYKLHGAPFMFNYLFADGHVKNWKIQQTTPSLSTAAQWWTAGGADD